MSSEEVTKIEAEKTEDRKAVFARATGRVQGVWFRGWVQEQANGRGIKGWVRNLADGSVEAMLVGTTAAVDEMLVAMGEGPSLAKVERVQTQPATGVIPEGFKVLATPRDEDTSDVPPSPSI